MENPPLHTHLTKICQFAGIRKVVPMKHTKVRIVILSGCEDFVEHVITQEGAHQIEEGDIWYVPESHVLAAFQKLYDLFVQGSILEFDVLGVHYWV